jgi:hypothetical protein
MPPPLTRLQRYVSAFDGDAVQSNSPKVHDRDQIAVLRQVPFDVGHGRRLPSPTIQSSPKLRDAIHVCLFRADYS